MTSFIAAAALLLALQGAEPVPNIEARVPDAPAPMPMKQEPLPDPLPQMSLEQRSAFRCGILFGLVASGQANGVEKYAGFPPLEERGKEFFVRTTAQLMDDERFTRPVVSEYMRRDVVEIFAEGDEGVAKRMPPCLLMLETSGI